MHKSRCIWCEKDPLYVDYHDKEWGCPVHDEKLLFEFLILEGMQAGLSWLTILKKRAAFRKAFAGFDPVKVARFDGADVERLMGDAGIVRNRMKIEAAIQNAKAFLKIQEEEESFDRYIWGFVNGKTLKNKWIRHEELPCKTEISDLMSKELKRKGFNFVGSTICYAFMQAVGMVNDHIVTCFRH